jgi:hypothetical protein
LVEELAIRDVCRHVERGRPVEIDDLHLDRTPHTAARDIEAGVDG